MNAAARKPVAAGLLLFREDGRLLLLRRSPELADGGTWSVPGGALEPGEEPLEAALREAREEMGSVPGAGEIGRHRADMGRYVYWTFAAIADEDEVSDWEPRLNWENVDWGWFDPSEMPEPLHPNVDEAVRRILE